MGTLARKDDFRSTVIGLSMDPGFTPAGIRVCLQRQEGHGGYPFLLRDVAGVLRSAVQRVETDLGSGQSGVLLHVDSFVKPAMTPMWSLVRIKEKLGFLATFLAEDLEKYQSFPTFRNSS